VFTAWYGLGFKCKSSGFNIDIRSEARIRWMHTSEQPIYKRSANTHTHVRVYNINTTTINT